MSPNVASDFGKELVEHLKSLTSENSGKKSELQISSEFALISSTGRQPKIWATA